MGPLELFLALLGIVLAVALSNPVIHGTLRLVDNLKRNHWSGAQYRSGLLQDKKHIAFDTWSCVFDVDREGNCTQTYDVRVANIGRSSVNEYFLPVFCDTKPLSHEAFHVWARMRGRLLSVEVDQWDDERSEGRFRIPFTKPIAPGERRRFSYGLTMPKLFRSGDDYYDWDVEIPCYDMRGVVQFAASWRIKYARWNIKGDTHVLPPIVAGNTVTWSVLFPSPRTRLHLELGIVNGSPAEAVPVIAKGPTSSN